MIKSTRCPAEPNLFESLKKLARKYHGKPLGMKWEDCATWNDLSDEQKDQVCKALSTYKMFQ